MQRDRSEAVERQIRLRAKSESRLRRLHVLARSTAMNRRCSMKRLILALLTGAAFAVSSPAYAAVKTIVLVHGAFADGSGWKPIADVLVSHGYSVRIVQEPETSFDADVTST